MKTKMNEMQERKMSTEIERGMFVFPKVDSAHYIPLYLYYLFVATTMIRKILGSYLALHLDKQTIVHLLHHQRVVAIYTYRLPVQPVQSDRHQ